MSKIGIFIHVRTLEPVKIADLDTLLIALQVELTDRLYGDPCPVLQEMWRLVSGGAGPVTWCRRRSSPSCRRRHREPCTR
jgi:hypothetical protein